MSQDIVADALNMIMNVKRAGKTKVNLSVYSKLLLKILEIMKQQDLIDYSLEDKQIVVEIKNLSECRAIKPRFYVKSKDIERYLRRYLPSRGIGTLLISTNKDVLKHEEAVKQNTGGSLLAYFF
jgi:ribosomal protein S8